MAHLISACADECTNEFIKIERKNCVVENLCHKKCSGVGEVCTR